MRVVYVHVPLCYRAIFIFYYTACSDGDVALVSGTSEMEGRVEVCMNRRWSTVCDDSWNDIDAQVVCRQAGFPNERAQALSEAPFGEGSGDILLDDVACTGTESGLINCTHTSPADPICTHRNDAGVRCNRKLMRMLNSLYLCSVLQANNL